MRGGGVLGPASTWYIMFCRCPWEAYQFSKGGEEDREEVGGRRGKMEALRLYSGDWEVVRQNLGQWWKASSHSARKMSWHWLLSLWPLRNSLCEQPKVLQTELSTDRNQMCKQNSLGTATRTKREEERVWLKESPRKIVVKGKERQWKMVQIVGGRLVPIMEILHGSHQILKSSTKLDNWEKPRRLNWGFWIRVSRELDLSRSKDTWCPEEPSLHATPKKGLSQPQGGSEGWQPWDKGRRYSILLNAILNSQETFT